MHWDSNLGRSKEPELILTILRSLQEEHKQAYRTSVSTIM